MMVENSIVYTRCNSAHFRDSCCKKNMNLKLKIDVSIKKNTILYVNVCKEKVNT